MKQLADRMNFPSVESGLEVLNKVKKLEAAGHNIVHMQLGQPDFDTPDFIKDAAIESMKAGNTGYSPSAGLPELKQAVVDYTTRWKGFTPSPSEVVVMSGGKPVFFNAFLVCINPGDEVLYPDPGYPIYRTAVQLMGGTPVPYTLREERGFRFELNEFESKITAKTKMIVINSPHNPTGGILTREDMEGIASLARRHDLFILSDEIYSRMLYDGEHVSIGVFPGMRDHAIILDGWSKTFAMTGWRLGYGIMPEAVAAQVIRCIANSTSCTPAFVQAAGVAALMGPRDEIDFMMSRFKARRDLITRLLNEIPGFRCSVPPGAFYAFPNISGTGMKSKELQTGLLEEAGVACLSGTSFGETGEGFLRFSYATSVDNIKEGMSRVKKYIEKKS